MKVFLISVFMLFSTSASACSYSGKPVQATVVDAETGVPVADAVVVMVVPVLGGIFETRTVDFLYVSETVTNDRGEFSFPGWDTRHTVKGKVASRAPVLYVLKLGYRPTGFSSGADIFLESSVVSSPFDGKVLELVPYKEGIESYVRTFTSFSSIVNPRTSPLGECGWKQLPRLVERLQSVRDEAEAANVKFVVIPSRTYLEEQCEKGGGNGD